MNKHLIYIGNGLFDIVFYFINSNFAVVKRSINS